MKGRRDKWTRSEDKHLTLAWCSHDIVQIAQELERTPRSVEHRARRLGLATVRDELTIPDVMRATSYDRRTIVRAARALRISPHPAPRVSIQPEQERKPVGTFSLRSVDSIVEWIKEHTQDTWRVYGKKGGKTRQGEWGIGIKPRACLGCGTRDRPHVARGLCKRCLNKAYRKRRSAQ